MDPKLAARVRASVRGGAAAARGAETSPRQTVILRLALGAVLVAVIGSAYWLGSGARTAPAIFASPASAPVPVGTPAPALTASTPP
jgi:hypothetical protein